MSSQTRPEHIAPPDVFYNDDEARKYAANSRMMEIQSSMSRRALELLTLPPDEPAHILDIGCGSGLSGEVLSEAGYAWTGVDIAPSMLGVAVKREVEGDLLCADIGQGLFFRPNSFDGAISISVIQWLCNADKKEHVPQRRLKKFFQSLYNCLKRGARAIFQFYPESPAQMTLITEAAMQCGFSGGLVVDFPNSTKAKKYYLCLYAGEPTHYTPPKALTGEEGQEASEERQTVLFTKKDRARTNLSRRGGNARPSIKSREWIQNKKERQRRQGKDVVHDSKYTGRKRKPRF